MLRMTRKADYGIMLLTHVAASPPGSVHAASDLARETHLPLPMVSKVLKALVRGGILASQRGAKGGYQLARPASDTSLADVIAALDGPIAMTDCIDGTCQQARWCPVERNWQKINRVVTKALRGITLADMTSPLVLVEIATPRDAARG